MTRVSFEKCEKLPVWTPLCLKIYPIYKLIYFLKNTVLLLIYLLSLTVLFIQTFCENYRGTQKKQNMQLQYVTRKQVSRVYLQKDGTASIGIVLKDGVKTGSRPVIKAIKKGSVAYRSHCVSEKDAIVSVCGQDARGMSRKEFKHLLREAESKIELELEYQIQEACLSKCGVYRMERIYLKLKKESETYGFVLRKYGFKHPTSPGYPVISNIREGGPADRDGRLKAGDRLLQIDDQDLETLSLSQVADILQAKNEATFTIEYKIALIENSQIRLGERTNLEIDCPDADLGLVLGPSGSRMVIEEIRKGSLADRCGAFRAGDDILAINNIDVAFLSSSKANNLLRSFKKEPGRLVLVANMERLALSRPNSCSPREKINPLYEGASAQLTPERDQQVPSNNSSLSPSISSHSLFNGSVGDVIHSRAESDYYHFQLKAIVMLREIIKNVANLENFIYSLNSNNRSGSVDNFDEFENNSSRDQALQWGKLSHLKILSTRIKNSSHSMAIHLAKNAEITSNSHPGNGVHPFDNSKDNSQNLNHHDVFQELMRNLVEIYSKKLMSKHSLEELQMKINQINSNCKKCKESCMLAALTTQKILLIISLNNKTKDIFSLMKKLIEDVLKILPCEDCQVSSRSRTGSEISRTTPHFRSLNQLSPKPSCSTQVLRAQTSCSATANRSHISRTSGGNSTDNLNNKPSPSVPSLFTNRTRSEYSKSTDDNSTRNVATSKASGHEAISNVKSKTKDCMAAQPSNYYETRCQSIDTDSLRFETPSRQSRNQSEVQTVHNSSLGFETPTTCMSFYDRASISGSSTLQSSTRTPNKIQNNSFSYEAELEPCKDNSHFEQKDNGRNYSSSIRKKIFRNKGLLNARRQNCKSAEVIADSESEPLKHSSTKVQKYSSEPDFLSPACNSSTERVSNNNKKDEHFFVNVQEIQDSKRESDGTKTDETRYWSPFHRSDTNDLPNILDISNWSAKSSHSMKPIDQDPNKRTMQDRVDVTLKNEGKGYGLSIEFLGSSLEDSAQVPRITVVSSQGAAHKSGILQKGDRILAINGQNTTGMSAAEFDHLKEEAFSADEVLLTVEFDIFLRDLHFGTFDVSVTKTSKTGLVYNDLKKGSPLVVKGIIKGSPAHRCGSLFPGDEVLYANNIRQEFFDVFKNTYERTEFVIIRVRRQAFKEKSKDEINLEQAEPSPFKSYDLTRTSIHSNHGSNSMILEQELILYRDPVARDFGFLIGQDQDSKAIYVTGIRPDGPADSSKVMRKSDMILQVNGIDLEVNKDGPIASLFHPTGDRLELKTRRILKYE